MRTVGQRVASIAPTRIVALPKTVDPHYLTAEHAAWRGAVLRRARFRCEGLGCGAHGVRLYADHVVELRDGGAPFDPTNGQALCASCHARKTARERARRHGAPGPLHP